MEYQLLPFTACALNSDIYGFLLNNVITERKMNIVYGTYKIKLLDRSAGKLNFIQFT